MTKEYQQFQTTVDHYLQMDIDHLEMFCRNLSPDEHFRFITFEKNNYRLGKITCQLYNYIPGSVFFFVESPMEIEAALDTLIELNPGVLWAWANLSYFDQDESGHASVCIELLLCSIPMRVSSTGQLIYL